ncbi:flagellar hook capping protein [Clostridium chromiireducens]|uniref:Basal-body rod modification protein FlgD n=1 Tax=Clostridium chromiireducens TaxID=225345 RepID=A0A399IZK9_9CLOT|nr:flagellar hook capping FlgD N-terminal domain-containing protein [Clostridium chromiireducens]RII36176.1 flagellar hook capping protein [Clostridium chromiireducens]
MAVETQLNHTYISGADAITNAKNAKAAQTVGKTTTDRGTLITKSTTDFDKNSFLKILSAQLSNLDPTQNQDSSAYVAQMAQFASMEQMQNLNTTMSDYAYQQMIGKKAIINEKYDDGTNVEGYVTKITKKSNGTYATMTIDGKEEEIDVSKIIGSVQTTDSNTTANNRAALNSDFLAASALADKQQNIVIATVDDKNKTVLIKGKVVGAYIDTVSSATVKIKVDVLDNDGKPTGKTKTYDYGDIVRAGDLTDEDMNVSLNTTKTTGTTTSDSTNTANNTSTSTEVAESNETVNTISSTTNDNIAAENATLSKIAGV